MTANWRVSTTPPGEWDALVKLCGGGFFHTPAALGVSLPEGELFYALAENGNGPEAIALGTRSVCRLSQIPRHAVLATCPATRPGVDAAVAAHSLAQALAAQGAAEVAMHSFDAPAATGGSRVEHRIDLSRATAEALIAACSSTQRRHIRRGEGEGWTLQVLRGREAVEQLHAVQSEAAHRARRRGEFFEAAPALAAGAAASLDAPWGTSCFATFAGTVLLNVVLIGWGNGRAFYLLGGSTPEGYRRSAAAWTHWRIMQLCARAGHRVYNLGGTPAGAEATTHTAHGLYRFKQGFGATQVSCKGNGWVFRRTHLRAHRLLLLGARFARRHISYTNSE